MKSYSDDNGIEMYSTENKGKSFVAESLSKPKSKSNIYRHMTAVSKMCTSVN